MPDYLELQHMQDLNITSRKSLSEIIPLDTIKAVLPVPKISLSDIQEFGQDGEDAHSFHARRTCFLKRLTLD